MKNKSKTLFYTILLLGFLLSILVFMYVYKAKKEETAELKASNDTLEERVIILKEYYDQMATYTAQIAEYTNEINQKVSKFPADVKEEDAIYLALNTTGLKDAKDTEDLLGIRFTNMKISSKDSFAVIPYDEIIKPAALEGYEKPLTYIQRHVIFTNLTNYHDMKELLNRINQIPEESAISNVAYTINKDNLLEGSVEVALYGLYGTTKTYVERNFNDYNYGLSDLFGTADSVVENPTAVNDEIVDNGDEVTEE